MPYLIPQHVLSKYRQQGQDALAWRKPPGASSRLTNEQLVQLVVELNKGAEYHDFPGHVWTRPRVNEVIKNRTAEAVLRSQL